MSIAKFLPGAKSGNEWLHSAKPAGTGLLTGPEVWDWKPTRKSAGMFANWDWFVAQGRKIRELLAGPAPTAIPA